MKKLLAICFILVGLIISGPSDTYAQATRSPTRCPITHPIESAGKCCDPSGFDCSKPVDNYCESGWSYDSSKQACVLVECPPSHPIESGGKCCEPQGIECLDKVGGDDNDGAGTTTRSVDPFEGCSSSSINTALGCIPVGRPTDFVAWFLRWTIGIVGGLAILLIIIAAFQIMTAQGNPERLNRGKETLTAAIAGLIFIIFSVFLLQLIGEQILRIPGL